MNKPLGTKAALIMDMPENCDDCMLCVAVLGKRYCPAKGTEISKGEKDCGCPLVTVPAQIDQPQAKSAAEASYIEGWKDCIEKICGGTGC